MEERARIWDSINDHPRDLMEMVEDQLIARLIDRRWRLFLCACGWRVEPLSESLVLRELLEVAEKFADGAVTYERVEEVSCAHPTINASWDDRYSRHGRAQLACSGPLYPPGYTSTFDVTIYALENAAAAVSDDGAEWAAQTMLFKDIFPNPFRPVTFSPAWQTQAAVGIASQMYEARDFANMPVLADALQDAGCDSPEILDHCRGAGPHVRGCWVVDLVLGKS